MRSFIRLVVALALASAVHPAAAQGTDPLPFNVGERLTYRVRVGRTGSTGRAVMAVSGPVGLRGVSTEVLSFDVTARVGLLHVTDRSKSWIDPQRMSALQFWKQESRPFGHSDQSVEIDGADRRWTERGGESGTTLSDAPLDELSFIYYLRTLQLAPGASLQVNRHFDAARNPTVIHVVRADTVTVGDARVPATVVEMRVRDTARYGGSSGAVRLTLSDDRCHVPLRMESQMPVVGTVVLTLISYDGVAPSCTGALRGDGAYVRAP
jgi:hypothetical protein